MRDRVEDWGGHGGYNSKRRTLKRRALHKDEKMVQRPTEDSECIDVRKLVRQEKEPLERNRQNKPQTSPRPPIARVHGSQNGAPVEHLEGHCLSYEAKVSLKAAPVPPNKARKQASNCYQVTVHNDS